jgi:N-carbamoylputrescine amidase
MENKKITIGLVQTSVGPDLDRNLDKTAKFIARTARKDASIVCLQELFASPYFCRTEDKKSFKTAEKIPGKVTKFLSEQAKANKITLVGGSIFEVDEGNYYNTSLTFDSSGKMIAKYRKVHIPQDPSYYEQYYFKPGNLGFVQVQLPSIKIAPLICYDQWYPEAARANALKGAELIFYPTAIGWAETMRKNEPFSAQRWQDAMRAHASMNGIFVAAANRVGKEGSMEFWGGSFIADPFGQVVAKASNNREEVLVADIDLSKITDSKEGWRFLYNRQPKSYSDLT